MSAPGRPQGRIPQGAARRYTRGPGRSQALIAQHAVRRVVQRAPGRSPAAAPVLPVLPVLLVRGGRR